MVFCVNINILETAKPLFITGEHDSVFASFFDANSVIREGVGRMQVENKQQARAFEHNDLVNLVFEGDISLWCSEPTIFLLEMVYGLIPFVQVLITE